MADVDEPQEILLRLLRDMERIASGRRPGPSELARAPLLEGWVRCRVPAFEPALAGAVSGHPLLPGSGRIITTSRLAALDPDLRWARTWSRWYRLGDPGRH